MMLFMFRYGLLANINFFALIAAFAAGIFVESMWYAPFFAGKAWKKEIFATLKSPDLAMKRLSKLFIFSYLSILLTACILADVLFLTKPVGTEKDLLGAMFTAMKIWLGFVLPIQLQDVVSQGKSWKIYSINILHQLTSLLVMALVFELLR